MKVPFAKFQGTGNDFVFIDEADLPAKINRVDLARKLCQRHYSVGADGLVVIQNYKDQPTDTFTWDFYNNDGSFAEMCGNAARCAVVYSHLRSGLSNCEFTTHIGKISGQYSENPSITFTLADPSIGEKSVLLPLGTEIRGFVVNTGVPHFVIVDDKELDMDEETCDIIQNAEDFSPDKINITLLQMSANSPIKTKTFERGVAAFTLACGTGVMASALIINKLFEQKEVELLAPGGLLKVEMSSLPSITLQGPASQIFTGEFEL